jgi:hypothetical protein
LNSTIAFFTGNAPFHAIEEFKEQYRRITMDLRNANGGGSSGPIEIGRPTPPAYAAMILDRTGGGRWITWG